MLKSALLLGAYGAAANIVHPSIAGAFAQSPALSPSDALTAIRARLAATPIQATSVNPLITVLTGPGGNVVILHGEQTTLIVDTFVSGAFGALNERIDALKRAPVTTAINTHWHFDHCDNNEQLRKLGAAIIAHANTPKRLSEAHDLAGMQILPSAPAALPTVTFSGWHVIRGNHEYTELGSFAPAHTDTDIWVHFLFSEVLHMGDTFFNGMYPSIDLGTGGNINGMIAAAEQGLKKAQSPRMRFVPGHGPLATREDLQRYRDMLVIVRDRIEKLKRAGRVEKEVVAAKPTADLDAVWGKGFVEPDTFVSTVFRSL